MCSVPTDEVPSRARVVIVGGGIVGASVAYHLTALGWTDVILVEQGQLSCGTTWHAAGLVGPLRATENGTRLVQYSADLYARLEAETGLATGYKRCGGLIVARTPDRMTQLRRTAATAVAFDLECEMLEPAGIKERYPIMATDDLLGGIWLPGDGSVNPSDVTASLAKGARNRGARIYERTRVVGVIQQAGAVAAVRTDRGDIEAEIIVNCAGQWAKTVGAMAGVTVPLHSAEHFYAVTEQIDGVHRDLPIMRDPDGYTYFKEEVGGLVVGGFEPDAKPWVSPDNLPDPFEFQLLPEDWDHFAPIMENAMTRIPALQHTGVKKLYNGPESFTPDNQFILGEAPELRNFYVGAGFNSVGIASAGGAGRALAEWVVNGAPTNDLSIVDIRRFARFNGNNAWLRDRVAEVLGLHYEVPWPNRELETARPFRRSPIHHLLDASFGSKMGWERPNVFAPPEAMGYTWGKPEWLRWCCAEQRATRNAVAVFDQTSFGKMSVRGRDAERVLQWLCTADVAVEPGRVVYTGMLNERGGYEADVTVTRISYDEYFIVTSSGSIVRDIDWITRHIPDDAQVTVTDVSGAYAVLGVMGPQSAQLLGLSTTDFPFATSRLVDFGYSTVRATRITYVGELGWELYVPAEFAVGVFERLREATNAGYHAINALRLEKGYRAWGADIGPDDNPVEAGLLFACKLKSGIPFLGRGAVEKARAQGPSRRLVSLVLDDPEPMIWGGELVLRDGAPVGRLTSAAWGETVGAGVALGYVRGSLSDGRYEVNIGGEICPATVHLRPPYDPTNARIRGNVIPD
jgi:glycine cleavage system aminomethyltransferase T/glycine/D-amino acid oxidase-like deaminating enzyme